MRKTHKPNPKRAQRRKAYLNGIKERIANNTRAIELDPNNAKAYFDRFGLSTRSPSFPLSPKKTHLQHSKINE